MDMNRLSYEGLQVDLALRKKLNELLKFRIKIEKDKKNETNPIKIEELKKYLLIIDELIGKIRYHSLDIFGVLQNGKD